MDERKILIADPSEEFVMALTEELGDCGIVKTCAQGNQTLELIGFFHPDVLVLDLALPDTDGLELIEKITALPSGPAILVMTRFVSDFILDVITRKGVSYIMYKPCDIATVAKRVFDLLDHLKPILLSSTDPRTVVTNMLLALGVPTKLRGYLYLREAVICYSRNPAQSITKELYPSVAEILGGNGAQVEHLIRTAIATAWESRDDKVWAHYFLPDPGGMIRRPSNRAFISRLTESMFIGEQSESSTRMCR